MTGAAGNWICLPRQAGDFSARMSTVQEIEQALSRLSPAEMAAVEAWIRRFKAVHSEFGAVAEAAAEYGATAAELDRFDERMAREIAADRANGRLKSFTGDIESALSE